ncbi:MAG TPA: ATP-binding cassette domain-containing protein [Candidatus Latescibacteria bacterium]|jgi:ATP-binding cassette subfamily F protein uup|nr:ATP-binding cassette domain-containing protein [Candidatus Latescibacterota bacterium]HJP32580.1 ATP-binding cassette domain-containing protein [Candidatus Latescibacterota bacterium]
MALLSLHDITLSFGTGQLLDGVSLQIEPGERLCLLGRNGAGKSTLMKIIEGSLAADGGSVARQPDTRVALLSQVVPADVVGTTRQVVAANVPERLSGPPVVDIVLTKMQLDPDADFSALSVGLKRRALLARALATEPDVLLLDEPTNHLDIDAIEWLETFLLKRRGSLLFITHDRTLTHRLATRILELDRGQLSNWSCDYATYIRRREAQLESQEKQDKQFDERLKQEEIWIRQGLQARRTRNEGRVRALMQMREDRRVRRTAVGGARLTIQESERSSRRVIEAEDVSFAYGEHVVLRPFSTSIMRGDKVGFIGPNGAGKTTLLRLLLGELEPAGGTMQHGLRLEVGYFDQLRSQLDDDQTVFDSVANGSDRVDVNGGTRHVYAYLQDFLFTREQAHCKVGVLSGGERNRLLLARLFTRPASVLALDEPTNDLDSETLEVLEAMLVAFSGTVLFVSHDREFLDNVATSTIVFDGSGGAHEYVGGYSDWVRQRPASAGKMLASAAASKRETAPVRLRKLGFNETRELAELPGKITTWETEVGDLHGKMSDPGSYNDGTDIGALASRLEVVEAELVAAYERWAALEELQEEAAAKR